VEGKTVIIQPILPIWLLVIVFAVLFAFVAWRIVAAVRGGSRRSFWPWILRGGMVVLVLAIMVRPGFGGGESNRLNAQLDVFLVVDTTTSIVAEDWGDGETRLQGVQSDIDGLLADYPGARFSLLTFDSTAIVRVPLTSDTAAMQSAVSVMTPEITLYSNGSSIAEANGLLKTDLERTAKADPDRSRVVYYFGDGEQTVDDPPDSFGDSADLVSGGGVLGYGTSAGGPMKVQTGYYDDDKGDDGYVEDGQGNEAISKIDEDNLKAIASQLGVGYQHRAATTKVEADDVTDRVTANLAPDGSRAGVIELYWIFAFALFALIVVDAIGATRRLREIADAAGRGKL
jgi:Ca-activated chloride channel family protein